MKAQSKMVIWESAHGVGSPSAQPSAQPFSPSQVGVLVIDEHEVVYLGLRLLLCSQLGVRRCLVAHDLSEAIDHARRYAPKVVILDPGVAGGTGRQIAEQVRAVVPEARLILLTSGEMPLRTARLLGASALLSKKATGAEILRVVRHVADGGTSFPRAKRSYLRLSSRESEVLAHIAGGDTNREIASRLQLAPDTVKQHAASVYRKLGVRNRTEAARRADELGISAAEAVFAAEQLWPDISGAKSRP